MIKSLIFLSFFYLFLFSIIGYGFFFYKFITNKKINIETDVYYVGFFGIIFLTFLSLILSFVPVEKKIVNILIHISGLFLAFYYYLKIKLKLYFKQILLISIFIISLIFISKTHDDFPYYHLPVTKFLYEQHLTFGLANIGYGWKLISSLFYFNSTVVFPYIKFYSFHFISLYFLIFFNFFCLKKIFHLNENYIVKIFYLTAFLYFNLSFNRIAEYGTDKAGQLFITVLIIDLISRIYIFKNKEHLFNYLLVFFPCILFSITLKTYFVPWLIILLVFILYLRRFNFYYNFLKSRSFQFSFFLISLFFITNLILSGCLSPLIEMSCSNFLEWRVPKTEVENLSTWLEFWSKGGAGPNYNADIPKEIYIKNLNWVSNWFNKYFTGKGLDQLTLYLFCISVIYVVFFKFKLNKIKSSQKNLIIFFILFLLLFILWFTKIPTLRYGGYLACFLFFTLIFIIIISNFRFNNQNFKKKVKILILIVFIVLNFKNIKRINEEFSRVDHYKFDNFPFFAIPNSYYFTVLNDNNFKIYSSKGYCWDAPSPCSKEANAKSLIILKKNNFVIIKKK